MLFLFFSPNSINYRRKIYIPRWDKMGKIKPVYSFIWDTFACNLESWRLLGDGSNVGEAFVNQWDTEKEKQWLKPTGQRKIMYDCILNYSFHFVTRHQLPYILATIYSSVLYSRIYHADAKATSLPILQVRKNITILLRAINCFVSGIWRQTKKLVDPYPRIRSLFDVRRKLAKLTVNNHGV